MICLNNVNFSVFLTPFNRLHWTEQRKVKVSREDSFPPRALYRLIGWVVLFLLLGVPFFGIASIRYDCHYDPVKLQFEERDGWDFIRIKGLGVILEVGKPIVPVDYIHLLIPEDQEAESIVVRVDSSFKISGVYKIKPFIPYKDSSLMDSIIPLNSETYPGKRAEIVGTGSFGGNRVVDIKVYPMEYNPESGEIVLFTDISIELIYGPSRKASVKQLYREPYSQYIIQKALRSLVDNDIDIPSYSYKPATIEHPLGGNAYPFFPSYLVITADSLLHTFRPFIRWMKKKGIRAVIVPVNRILKHYSYDPISEINDDAGAIRAFLIDAYEKGIQWVLLGGDEDIIPVRYGTSENNDSTVP